MGCNYVALALFVALVLDKQVTEEEAAKEEEGNPTVVVVIVGQKIIPYAGLLSAA